MKVPLFPVVRQRSQYLLFQRLFDLVSSWNLDLITASDISGSFSRSGPDHLTWGNLWSTSNCAGVICLSNAASTLLYSFFTLRLSFSGRDERVNGTFCGFVETSLL